MTAFHKLLVPALIAALATGLLFLLRGVSFSLLRGWAAKAETKIDKLILEVLRTPSVYWCIAIGLYIGIGVSEMPQKYAFYLTKVIHVIVIFSITIAVAGLAGRAFRHYVEQSNLPIPTTGLVYGIIKGTILLIGLLIMLSVVGISIAPLITALGVGGLAVALALQDTLSNLFAGIVILLEKSIRVGDFIKVESGQEGYVADITWRTTRVQMLSNNMVVIPNNKLSQSIVTNYHLPDKRITVSVVVRVDYSSDPVKIERILLEEAKKAIGNVPGLLAEPQPSAQLAPGFGESSLDFTLSCWAGEYTEQYLAQHELRKRILARLREEGIGIPLPQRTVHLVREQEDGPA
jgi:small-conductance mechanosensitive channel